ncbi:MAG: AFG1/ZapE family ATPase, partial [Lysobacterales bacterium]
MPESLGPWARYQDDIEHRGFSNDPAQAIAVQRLDALFQALQSPAESPGFFSRLRGARTRSPKGLYLWGGVGRGKTYLMDTFYECLTLPKKRRAHF